MKITWETEDIYAGLYVIRNSSPIGSKDFGFAVTVCYKIGFCHETKDKHYGAMSMLTDGWYYSIGTKEDVSKMLNEDEHGYRPLTKHEYLRLIEYTSQGFVDNRIR